MARRELKWLKQSVGISALTAIATLSSSCSVSDFWELRTTPIGDQAQAQSPPPEFSTQTVPLSLPSKFEGEGGLIAIDINNDGQREFIITQPGYIGAYSLAEGPLWEHQADIWLTSKSEAEGLPGLHAPGVQAEDIDQDGTLELIYITSGNTLLALSAASGTPKYEVELPPVESKMGRWEHAIIANFSGEGNTDLLLQASRATNKDYYIRDNVQTAFRIADLLSLGKDAQPLWTNEDFVSLSHGSAKVFDINGDGKDEVLGAMVLGADGQILHDPGMENTNFPHIDSIAVDDIDPSRPGLEVVMPEERGRKRVFLLDENGTIWVSGHRRRAEDRDGDKVAIGDFDPTSPGLEMWFRGDESRHFTVLNAQGNVVASYKFANRRPENWTEKGLEVITRIRWTGDDQDFIVAKERHEAGDVGIFDAMTGQLIAQFPNATKRLYVVDIVGDWREEIVLLSDDELTVYQNQNPNPNPDRESLWSDRLYRRQKMTWNYYSP